uniref:Uncharacterized protein n=1 Tax=Chromera velia CCMP2878 TaxID=1169474 RepID=A0A0G4GQN2_9ALVE|eukprot:Cvel_22948.t1-p1 / transcript=Cvel_22948.t1 / gene=Cvel_22948 / organism=Chromera_velia_CCMP2878 / gene_product=hypothetical protein / transcript_product=hypothetical protein / location=Cvel_scaffold2310:20584-30045(-) / protein_length=997 / sequence_SO=supercontig / SO=protein_coding / is_pseudo=false
MSHMIVGCCTSRPKERSRVHVLQADYQERERHMKRTLAAFSPQWPMEGEYRRHLAVVAGKRLQVFKVAEASRVDPTSTRDLETILDLQISRSTILLQSSATTSVGAGAGGAATGPRGSGGAVGPLFDQPSVVQRGGERSPVTEEGEEEKRGGEGVWEEAREGEERQEKIEATALAFADTDVSRYLFVACEVSFSASADLDGGLTTDYECDDSPHTTTDLESPPDAHLDRSGSASGSASGGSESDFASIHQATPTAATAGSTSNTRRGGASRDSRTVAEGGGEDTLDKSGGSADTNEDGDNDGPPLSPPVRRPKEKERRLTEEKSKRLRGRGRGRGRESWLLAFDLYGSGPRIVVHDFGHLHRGRVTAVSSTPQRVFSLDSRGTCVVWEKIRLESVDRTRYCLSVPVYSEAGVPMGLPMPPEGPGGGCQEDPGTGSEVTQCSYSARALEMMKKALAKRGSSSVGLSDSGRGDRDRAYRSSSSSSSLPASGGRRSFVKHLTEWPIVAAEADSSFLYGLGQGGVFAVWDARTLEELRRVPQLIAPERVMEAGRGTAFSTFLRELKEAQMRGLSPKAKGRFRAALMGAAAGGGRGKGSSSSKYETGEGEGHGVRMPSEWWIEGDEMRFHLEELIRPKSRWAVPKGGWLKGEKGGSLSKRVSVREKDGGGAASGPRGNIYLAGTAFGRAILMVFDVSALRFTQMKIVGDRRLLACGWGPWDNGPLLTIAGDWRLRAWNLHLEASAVCRLGEQVVGASLSDREKKRREEKRMAERERERESGAPRRGEKSLGTENERVRLGGLERDGEPQQGLMVMQEGGEVHGALVSESASALRGGSVVSLQRGAAGAIGGESGNVSSSSEANGGGPHGAAAPQPQSASSSASSAAAVAGSFFEWAYAAAGSSSSSSQAVEGLAFGGGGGEGQGGEEEDKGDGGRGGGAAIGSSGNGQPGDFRVLGERPRCVAIAAQSCSRVFVCVGGAELASVDLINRRSLDQAGGGGSIL